MSKEKLFAVSEKSTAFKNKRETEFISLTKKFEKFKLISEDQAQISTEKYSEQSLKIAEYEQSIEVVTVVVTLT